jgi:hypothetical protein
VTNSTESNALVVAELSIHLPTAKPEYKSMLQNIDEKAPAVARATSNFHKSHSQFMGVTLDVTAITPVRSVKHTLAEIDHTRSALQEAYIGMRKKENKLKKLERKLEAETDDLERELLEIKIIEAKSHLISTQNHVQGAIRKLNFFTNQYDSLMQKLGKTELTEEDYELEEVKYHIMTCLKQALTAARARGGSIDEGNMIYIFDLGLPAAQVQAEVFAYLSWENEMMVNGKVPTHQDTVAWLERCADQWAECPAKFAESRGFQILDHSSLTNVAIADHSKKDE